MRMSLPATCRAVGLAMAASALFWPTRAEADYGPNLLPEGSFENVSPTYVPWAGVDDGGNICGVVGKQLAVGDDGKIGGTAFGPSIAVADLNGDGKPDIVMADSYGYFWFYPNSGTPQKPVFTQGEVMPIWLGEDRTDFYTEAVYNLVPRIQLLDPSGGKKPDIFAGTYEGNLFHIRNVGSSTTPAFQATPADHTPLLINTRRQGVLWCNYLSPCLTTLFGSGNTLDMIIGEGTYSANSIYLLRNMGTADNPAFDEDHTKKIIPGNGLEQLTPAVVDWNNDGKPDIICGDRDGHVTIFLNNSSDPDNPTFAEGTPLTIAGQDTFGGCITVCVADLTGNHLPNLLIGSDDGRVSYALNTGKLGAPLFVTPLAPLKGVLPPGYKYTQILDWPKGGAAGDAYELVEAVNPTIDPTFAFPDGVKSKYAMKFTLWPFKSVYFPGRFLVNETTQSEHVIRCNKALNLKLNQKYRVHFWVKADGNVDDFNLKMNQGGSAGGEEVPGHFYPKDFLYPISAGSSWSEVNQDVIIDDEGDKSVTTWNYNVAFTFSGQTTFYIDDVEVQEEK